MFKEKLLISSCRENHILIDKSKLVDKLGTKFPIPVEVFPDAMQLVEDALYKMGATEAHLRPAVHKDGPVITESGNFIIDVRFQGIEDTLERELKLIPGVIESGLFIGYSVKFVGEEEISE